MMPGDVQDNSLADAIASYQFLQQFRKKVPTAVDLWVLHIITGAALAIPVLFSNSVFRFFKIRNRVVQQINSNWWTWYFTPAVVVDQLGMDVATVSTEAFGISAPAFIVALLTATLSLPLLFQRYSHSKRKQLMSLRLADLIGMLNGMTPLRIQLTTLSIEQLHELIFLIENTHDPLLRRTMFEFIKMKLGLDPVDKTYYEVAGISQLLESKQYRDRLLKLTESKLSRIEEYCEAVQAQRLKSKKYASHGIRIAFFIGVTYMKFAADDLKQDSRWTCDVYPMWAMYFERCSVTERADAMSLFTILWITMSATGFGVYSAVMSMGLINQVCKKLHLAEAFRHAASIIDEQYEYWAHDERRWAHNEFIRRVFQRVGLPVILCMSFKASLDLLNAYGQEVGCGSADDMVSMMMSGARNTDYTCNTTDLSLGATIFVSYFEFFMGYGPYVVLDTLSDMTAAVLERLTRYKDISTQTLLKMMSYLDSYHETTGFCALLCMLLVGLVFMPDWIAFSGRVFQEGIHKIAILKNATLPLPDPSDFNITTYVRKLDETHYDVTITPACPDYGIISVFFLGLFDYYIDCDELLQGRGISTYVAPSWGSTSVTFTFVYEALQLLLIAGGLYQLARSNFMQPGARASENRHQFFNASRQRPEAPQPDNVLPDEVELVTLLSANLP